MAAGTYAHTTRITLTSSSILDPNELLGCEFRVAVKDAANANQVFLAGTVISQLGDKVMIRDEGQAIATAWASRAHKPSACFYDLREGYTKGVQTGALSTGQYFWGTAGWVAFSFETVHWTVSLRKEPLRGPI